MRTYLFLLLFSASVSYFLTLALARRAAERGWACREGDGPEGEGTPRLGGAAVVIALFSALGFLLLRGNQVTARVLQESARGIALLGALAAVFLLGLYDDLRGARPWQKLLVQAFSAVGLYVAGFRVELLSNPFTRTPIELGWLSIPVTLLWLVAISNAFNLIDGLDGLAAGVGLFASLALFLLATLVGNVFPAAVAAILAGALLGFLPHNFHPARIYLGDSGSLTIGLALAALSIASSQKGPVLITLAIPILIFGLPLLEVSVTTMRRLLSGHPLFRRDEEHLHHRLVKIGAGKQLAVLVLYAIAALFALSSLLLFNYTGALSPVIALLCGALAWLVVRQMQYPEFAELDAHFRLALRSQPRVLRNQIGIRKATAACGVAASPAELWNTLAGLLEQLDFDRARCELRAAAWGAPLRFDWQSRQETAGSREQGQVPWVLEIPLVQEGVAVGAVRLERALGRGVLLFRVCSLVELISIAFTSRLLWFAGREREPGLAGLPAALKAAAGAGR